MNCITNLIDEIQATAEVFNQACYATLYSHKAHGMVDMVSTYGLAHTLEEINSWMEELNA